MRSEFEKLPEIAQALKDDVFWHDECKKYQASDDDALFDAAWVNGAWHIYQKQHKKIDDLVKWSELHIEDYNSSEKDNEHDRGWFNAVCQVFKMLKRIEQ